MSRDATCDHCGAEYAPYNGHECDASDAHERCYALELRVDQLENENVGLSTALRLYIQAGNCLEVRRILWPDSEEES